jgi:hypothetical protein
MTKEEIEKLKQARQDRANKLNVGGGVINPNPSTMTIKWHQTTDKAKLEGGREIDIPSGAFGFYRKSEDGEGKNHFIAKEKFALAIIDHSLIQFQGVDMDASGRKVARSYWSNEIRQSDSMTTPMILKIKDASGEIETHVGSRKELKERFGLKAAVHCVYGVTVKGEIVKLQLPWYSYSKGSERFKTHGDTLLDADAKSTASNKGSSALKNRWLTYSGFHELTTGTSKYTAPIFQFSDEFNDEMQVLMFEKEEEFDKWYDSYHTSNIQFIDKGESRRDDTYQGESKEGTESQATTTTASSEEEWESGDDDDIPF